VHRRKASRVNRYRPFLAPIFAVCVVALLAGCKEPQSASETGAGSAAGFVKPGTDIVIKQVRTFVPSDAIAGSNDEYYVVTFTFTNNQGASLAPRIDHFVIQDLDNRRYFGADSGNVSLVGISNYTGVLKVGDSHDYTVGFRVPSNASGTLFYDNTF
jgi:hypothetical protein